MRISWLDLFSVEWAFNVFLPILICVGFIFTVKYFHLYNTSNMLLILRGSKKKHDWKTLLNPSQQRCSSCETLLVTSESFHCDCCGVCVDSQCLRRANDTVKCKIRFVDTEGPMKHHYIKGNLSENAECDICEDECTDDLRCVWCHRTVHARCRQMLGEVWNPKLCDFGKLKNVVLPPNHVLQGRKRNAVGRSIRYLTITQPTWEKTWTPMFVVANKKSGNMVGGAILSAFRAYLNPLQVVDLSEKDPAHLCQLLSALPEGTKPFVMVAGGDGTVAWILTSLYRSHLKTVPSVGVIPLGTGNDLSRILGWGAEEPNPFSPTDYISKAQQASAVSLDRWEIKVKETSRTSLLSRSPMQVFMYNYMSIGVDARVTLDFHETRQSPFYIYSSRFFNKMLYLVYGTHQVVERECQGLEKRLELYMDGVQIDLPPIESIVLLNIPYWGGGVKLWEVGADFEGTDQILEQSMNDGKVEVVGISSSFHVAQLQLGLSQPHRFGQASHVKVVLKSKAPVQIDGEPWLQAPSHIDVTVVSPATVLQYCEQSS